MDRTHATDRAARRARENRALAVSLIASVAVHASVLDLPLRTHRAESAGTTRVHLREAGMKVVRISEVERAAVAEAETVPTEIVERLLRSPEPEPDSDPESIPSAAAASTSAPPRADGASAAERLRPATTDPRLWVARPLERVDSAGEPTEQGELRASLWSALEVRGALEPAGMPIRVLGIPVAACSGPYRDRCGVGVAPWNLERADREAAFQQMLRDQAYWSELRDRNDSIRRRMDARRDTVGGR